MSERNLAVLILQDVGECALQHARCAALKTGSMLAERSAATSGLNADKPYLPVGDELVKGADRIRAAAYAGNHCVGQPSLFFKNLRFDFAADATVEVAHHGGVRVRAES